MSRKLRRLDREVRSLDGCLMNINLQNCKDFLK